MSFFEPNWPTPKHIKSIVTTRDGGFSKAPWESLNLALHVEDNPINVTKNRELLKNLASLPAEPEWLNQTHSIKVVHLQHTNDRDADASITHLKNQVAVVLTADCLPLLVSNKQGTEVAAIHAGWKGLLDGIVTETIQNMNSVAEDLMVWLGPAISQENFEVGFEIKQQFGEKFESSHQYFKAHKDKKYLADLYGLVSYELGLLGVKNIYGGDQCSYAQKNKFYSYRREGVTGRMASMIWISDKD